MTATNTLVNDEKGFNEFLKKEIMRNLITAPRDINELARLPAFVSVPSRSLVIAFEELVFERMIAKDFNGKYSIAHASNS